MKESLARTGIGPLCMLFGKTRFAFYKKERVAIRCYNDNQATLEMVHLVRRELPCLGTPKLYHMLKKPLADNGIKMGRDALHRLLCQSGLTIRPRKRYVVTTNSNHWMKKHPNLVKGITISEPDQLWVSDITYIQVGSGFNFLSLVTDAYSKQIMGYCLHPNLDATGCLNALRMALNAKSNFNARHIHHSDRGTQYCCGDYVSLLRSSGIEISMTENGDPYENAIAERVNGILKYEFDLNAVFVGRGQALEAIGKGIKAYNELRPHMSCNYLTPIQAHKMNGVLEKRWKPKARSRYAELILEG